MKPPNHPHIGRTDGADGPSGEELVRRYFDGELTEEQERDALLVIAEDPLLRECLRSERSLPGELQELQQARDRVPDGFSDRVMKAVHERDVQRKSESEQVVEGKTAREASETTTLERLTRVLEQMMEPARFELRPVWAIVALLALIAGGVWTLQAPQTGSGLTDGGVADVRGTSGTNGSSVDAPLATRVVAEEAGSVWIRFVFIDPDAEQLAVAGDFTGWEPLALTREQVGDRQVWTGMVQVPRGEHNYMFIRNGEEWVTDPFAEITRDDGFGNENAVLYL